MGVERVKKSLRRRAALLIFFGAILFLGMGFIAFAFAVTGELDGIFWFSFAVACLGVFFIVLGIREGSLKTSGWVKRNPDLLRQAEELYSNVVYEDKYIVCSNRHIGSKRNPASIASFDEVIGLYVRKTRYNFLITVQKELIVVTQKGEISVSVYSDKKIDGLVDMIAQRCPGVRLGYSPENVAYFNQVHKDYKERLKAMRQ